MAKVVSKNTVTGEVVSGTISDIQQVTEVDAQDSTVSDWNAQEITTDGVRITDPGLGAPVILRHFFFKALTHPVKPTKEQLVSQFKSLIETTLWADGLVPREDGRVEVHTSTYLKNTGNKALYQKMVKEKADFVIQVMAEPKKGILLHEKPTVL